MNNTRSELNWHKNGPLPLPDSFYESLDHMRKRPGMFFGKTGHLSGLAGFFMGFDVAADYCRWETGLKLDSFSRWLAEEKGLKGTWNIVWPALLEMNFETEEEAYDAFFVLFHEYHLAGLA